VQTTPRASTRTDPIALASENWEAAGWGDVSSGMALVTSIMRVQQLLLARVETTLRPFDLTFARFEVLMLLTFSSRGALPVGKIGERLQVHPASVTNAVQRLEEVGLVVRSANPDDGRSVIARITPDGRALAQRAAEALNAAVFSDVGLPPDRHEATLDVLAEWRRSHGDFE
jgi:DNA-binding MarR family transcriptional regulator